MYSRSQNNVNVVYCNYKETNSGYNVIAKRNSPQTLLIVGNIFKLFVWNFEEACAILNCGGCQINKVTKNFK